MKARTGSLGLLGGACLVVGLGLSTLGAWKTWRSLSRRCPGHVVRSCPERIVAPNAPVVQHLPEGNPRQARPGPPAVSWKVEERVEPASRRKIVRELWIPMRRRRYRLRKSQKEHIRKFLEALAGQRGRFVVTGYAYERSTARKNQRLARIRARRVRRYLREMGMSRNRIRIRIVSGKDAAREERRGVLLKFQQEGKRFE